MVGLKTEEIMSMFSQNDAQLPQPTDSAITPSETKMVIERKAKHGQVLTGCRLSLIHI